MREGSVWRAREGGAELRLLYADPSWGHRGVLVDDGRANKLIDPALLGRDYALVSEGEGAACDLAALAAARPAPEPALMTTQNRDVRRKIEERLRKRYTAEGTERRPEDEEAMTAPQLNYLSELSKRAGVELDTTLSKSAASRRISELKRQLAAAKPVAA